MEGDWIMDHGGSRIADVHEWVNEWVKEEEEERGLQACLYS